MLKLYHQPLSANSRRVWIALLEKQLEFELVELRLDGDQLQPEFLALNPFHHIPVLLDDDFTVVESLAILDYLEAKYPTPAMLPKDPKALTKVRMVEMVTVNELMPAMTPLINQMMGFAGGDDSQKIEAANQKIATVLKFFESLLGHHPYFSGELLTLADIVAGCAVTILPILGFSLSDNPKLRAWVKSLMQRPAWQTTHPTPEAIEAFKSRMQALMAQYQPERS
ncbi:glutathione S-transferase family protein [Fischerella thermalis]|jgi:glutathione S-transferase|uniref:Glutathione S-transferase domain protein n=3 Tax=Fischerella TaxID=1190 RepID=G6FQ40_9CYAN|nr:glutathione S-transferase family protein [Fischerella thermalis]PLZ99626.1 glutathione S-transferase family protein [Fischerella thermalis CCMEE 5328]PMB12124.1 glutathione S-transferase family protein [Fischerella thermalis CCMEE 5273]EHC17925.1 Glutathione S-transferase domain protein [Fischerella thermalis JSC-11]PLZ06621.1 glutathione S-transferase family protein [Fischerella thermalis WC1110]PLZ15577.1 glutathione S-transferase family protein [Fischerella thermalis WC119]